MSNVCLYFNGTSSESMLCCPSERIITHEFGLDVDLREDVLLMQSKKTLRARILCVMRWVHLDPKSRINTRFDFTAWVSIRARFLQREDGEWLRGKRGRFNVSRRKVARVLARREVEIKKSNFILSKKLELCDFISMYSHYIYIRFKREL